MEYTKHRSVREKWITRWWLSIFLAKSLFFYSQLSFSSLQERGYKVSISNSSLSLAQISYCSLLTILISDLFCSTSYRPIRWPSRISNSVIYVLAIFMGSIASTSETERERGREKEMLPYHFPAWYCNNCLFFFFFIYLFSCNLSNDLDAGSLRCPQKCTPSPWKRKHSFAAVITDLEAAFPWVVGFGAGWKESDPTISDLINKATDFWECQKGEQRETSFRLGLNTITFLQGSRAFLPLLLRYWGIWAHLLGGAGPLFSFV